LADLLVQTAGVFKQLRNQALHEDKPESTKKWLDLLGDTMFACILGPRKVAISKSLLALLGYDIEEFSV
jgi:hypothetical protein